MNRIMETVLQVKDFVTNPHKYIVPNSTDAPTLDGGSMYIRTLPLSEIIDCHELGQGGFATVYALPNEKLVLKVARDAAYRAYYHFIRTHQSNPFVPRIYYHTNVGAFDIYVLERLLAQRDDYRDSDEAMQTALALCTELSDIVSKKNLGHFAKITCPHIQELRDEYGVENFNDAYGHNMMLRENPDGTYQPVITDPSGSYSPTNRRNYSA